MSTIYTNGSNRLVKLDLPVEPIGDVQVTVRYEDEVIYTATVTDLSFTLPFNLTQLDREMDITWSFSYLENGSTNQFTTTTHLSVVTPILPIEEIKKIVNSEYEQFSDEEIYNLEKEVRYVIQVYTGQSFGKMSGKISVTGSGEPMLKLPMKLNKLRSVNSIIYWSDTMAIRGNGWYLVSLINGVPSIKADFDGYHYNPNGGVISAPRLYGNFQFNKNKEFVLDGDFGWNEVPGAVQEAAKLLINDYACGESSYRDRYIKSMQTTDWQITFHDGAFTSTGNIRANQLLNEYVVLKSWLVV